MDNPIIYRAANVILKHYGAENALALCARRARTLLEAGDMEGLRAWQRIENVVRELTRSPDDRDAVN